MDPQGEYRRLMTRRYFLGSGSGGIGAAALATMVRSGLAATEIPTVKTRSRPYPALPGLPLLTGAEKVWKFTAKKVHKLRLKDTEKRGII